MKKKIISIIIIVIVMIGGFVGFKYYQNINYSNNFKNTFNEINGQTNACKGVSAVVVQTWGDAISNNEDFSEAIEQMKQNNEKSGTIKSLNNNKNDIDRKMSKLKNPNSKYKEQYDLLLNLYAKYNHIYNQVIDPNGSYDSYSKDIDNTYNQFNEIEDKIKAIIK